MEFVLLNNGKYLEYNTAKRLLKLEIDNLVHKKALIRNGDLIKVNFVGLVITSDQLILALPKVFDRDEQGHELTDIELARLIFQVLLVYFSGSSRKSLSVEPENIQGDIIHGITAEKILTDYIQKGYLNFKSKAIKKGFTGKINWDKTIIDSTPIHSNNNVIYEKTLVEKKKNKERLITTIHKWIVFQCWLQIGWLMDMPTPEHSKINLSRSKMIYLLQNLQNNVYDNNRKYTIENLLKYLKTGFVNQDLETGFYLGSTNFDLIWEDICTEVFKCGGWEKVEKKLGFEWDDSILLGGQKYTNTVIPDILLKDDDHLLVVDAKNYDLKKGRPGQVDLWKQIYYANSMDKVAEEHNLKLINLLIFPGFKKHLGNSEASLLSTIYPTIDGSIRDIHKPIFCFGLDLIQAMKVYTKSVGNFSYLNSMIKEEIR